MKRDRKLQQEREREAARIKRKKLEIDEFGYPNGFYVYAS